MREPEFNAIDLTLATADPVLLPELTQRGIRMHVLRLDRIHPVVSGNKWFKLKGHLQEARDRSARQLLTFGGAWSNHIIATAWAAREAGLPVTGIIRGEEPAVLSATLRQAAGLGMQLKFISREQYHAKTDPAFLLDLATRYPGVYIIPEGGAGPAGIRGSAEIPGLATQGGFTHLCCAIGTGTMYLGLSAALLPGQQLIGIPVLKGMNDLSAIAADGFPEPDKLSNCILDPGYSFGGYARKTAELLEFMNFFYQLTGIPTDFVYTSKLLYGVLDRVRKELFPPGSRILVIHSGGLQGNQSLPPGTLEF